MARPTRSDDGTMNAGVPPMEMAEFDNWSLSTSTIFSAPLPRVLRKVFATKALCLSPLATLEPIVPLVPGATIVIVKLLADPSEALAVMVAVWFGTEPAVKMHVELSAVEPELITPFPVAVHVTSELAKYDADCPVIRVVLPEMMITRPLEPPQETIAVDIKHNKTIANAFFKPGTPKRKMKPKLLGLNEYNKPEIGS